MNNRQRVMLECVEALVADAKKENILIESCEYRRDYERLDDGSFVPDEAITFHVRFTTVKRDDNAAAITDEQE